MSPKPMPLAARFERYFTPEPNSGCWLWTGVQDRFGHGNLFIGKRGDAPAKAHRVAWMVYHGEIPDGLWVLHKCDTPSCVNPDHLYLVTHADNTRDMKVRRRAAAGEKNGETTLTQSQALLIRLSSERSMVLAAQFGVSRKTVRNIKRGLTWKYLKPEGAESAH